MGQEHDGSVDGTVLTIEDRVSVHFNLAMSHARVLSMLEGVERPPNTKVPHGRDRTVICLEA